MREGGSIGSIEDYLPALHEILQRHGVVLAYLYGSQVRGQAGPLSDVDVAVLFADDVPEAERLNRVAMLTGELMILFRRNDVYVVDLGQAPPLLRNNVRLDGKLIFCTDENVRIEFEVRALRDYEDTKPLRQIQYYYLRKSIENGTFGHRRLLSRTGHGTG